MFSGDWKTGLFIYIYMEKFSGNAKGVVMLII